MISSRSYTLQLAHTKKVYYRMQLPPAVVTLLLFYIPTSVHSQLEISCSTSNGERGICISAKQCPLVIEVVRKYGNNIPYLIKNQIRALACVGKKGVTIPVCCSIASVLKSRSDALDIIQQTSLKYSGRKGMELLRSFPDCGDLEDDTKREHPIAAAIETAEGEFPWMALLKYETAGRPFLCGGSLITNRFVLTAAHCATAHVQLIGVRLGEHNLDTEQDCLFHDGIKIACPPPYEEYGIEEIRIHPKYMKGSISHDIALIKLDKNVEFKSHIGPICLPINYTLKEFDPDQIFNIAGWGKTEDDRPSSILLKAEVKHQHRSICRTFYENSPVSENHICAVGEGRQATCLGDSGGPLFYRYRDGYIQRFFQAGVISFGGQGCGVNKNQPGVFASILDMLPWITQNLY